MNDQHRTALDIELTDQLRFDDSKAVPAGVEARVFDRVRRTVATDDSNRAKAVIRLVDPARRPAPRLVGLRRSLALGAAALLAASVVGAAVQTGWVRPLVEGLTARVHALWPSMSVKVPEHARIGTVRASHGASDRPVSPPKDVAPFDGAPDRTPNTASPSASPSASTPESGIARLQRPNFSSPAPRLSAERALLDKARLALTGGRYDTAMRALDAHRRKFSRGILVEEREALAIETLATSGRREEARSRAARFVARFPHSMFAVTVNEALQSIP
jgi:hypothetical protein